MQRLKLLAVACMAVFALTAITTASASAAACTKKAGSKKFGVCVNGEALGSPTEAKSVSFQGHIKSGTKAHIYIGDYSETETAITVTCTAAAPFSEPSPSLWSGGNKSANVAQLALHFSSCKVKQPGEALSEAKCSTSGVTFGLSQGGMNGSFGPLTESVTFKAAGETEPLATLQLFGNKCASNGVYKLTGTLHCTLQQPEVETVEKLVVCKPEQNHLKWIEQPAAADVEEVIELLSKGKFSVIESS